MATSRGIDVSTHQGAQDWAAHRRDGIVFAFAKASEGQRSRDSRFDTHIAGILKAGLVGGAYHFAWPNQSAATEAANYIAAVRPYARPGFLHWLDLERYPDGRNYAGRSAAQIRAYATAWIAAVQRAFPGQRVGIYTSGSDIAAGHVPAGIPLWYPAYPWGAAAYSRAESASQPRPSGRAPLIWQFTSDPIDRSICYLSEAALRAWAGGDDTSEEDDDMQLGDKVKLNPWVAKHWPHDTGLDDEAVSVQTAIGSGYAFARLASDNTTKILAQLGAQAATIDKLVDALGSGGGLTAAEIRAAAEAGAQAALAKLGDRLQEG